MKIAKVFLGTFCLLTLAFSGTVGDVKAAKNPTGKIKIIDGKPVSYDDNVINGSVSDFPLYNKNINKIMPRGILKEKKLNVPFETQINNYYCGPASAAMVVNSLRLGTYSQQYMANLLGTTTNGTSAGSPVEDALNTVVKGSRFQFYWAWHYDVNDLHTVKINIVSAIENGNPVMVNTAESPGDSYLRGHNTGYPLYHFGVVSGYYNYGDKVVYLDPGYGRFNGFVKSQIASIRDLSYAMGTRGYAW